MSEWLKILVTALSGLVVGVLLEPVRAQIALHMQLRNLRRALYCELSSFYSLAVLAEECAEGSRMKQKCVEDLKKFRFSAYGYAKTNPAVLYALTEAWSFDGLVREWESSTGKQIDSFPAYALELVGIGLMAQELSEREFRRVDDKTFRDYLARKDELRTSPSWCLCAKCFSELEVEDKLKNPSASR